MQILACLVLILFQLYALMFSAAAQSFTNSADAKDWYLAIKSGLEAIMKYGQAKPGSRSMASSIFISKNKGPQIRKNFSSFAFYED